MEFNKNYFRKYADIFHKTPEEYLSESEANYAIIAGDRPLCFDDGLPVIYGDLSEAESDATCESDVVVTERELLDRFCTEELAGYASEF